MTDLSALPAQTIGDRRSEIGDRKEPVQHFSQLDAWKLAKELIVMIYKWTKEFPGDEKFGLVSQLRRAAVSIASNIAEGFGRRTAPDKKNFYDMAISSTNEVECQIVISYELKFLTDEQQKQGVKFCERIKQTINGLIRSLNRSNSELRTPNSASHT